MIFKNRRAIEEEVQRRMSEIERDKQIWELAEQVRKLTWRVETLEASLNPNQKTYAWEAETTMNPM